MRMNTLTRGRLQVTLLLWLSLVLGFALAVLWGSLSQSGTLAQASYGPSYSQAQGNCAQILANSDFESTGGWVEYSKTGEKLISTFPPPSGAYHSGTHGAYLADYNNAHDYIAQSVTIPSDATQAILTFWWQVETQESQIRGYDFLTVTVDAPLGQAIATLGSLSNQDASPTWQKTSFDLLSYRGQTIALRFDAITDANRPTAFYLDDITLEVCQPSPTPTSTPTATPTPIPTTTPAVSAAKTFIPFIPINRQNVALDRMAVQGK